MNLTNEFEPIREWAKERGLYENPDHKMQFIKLCEEFGELANAIVKSNHEDIEDAIGDIAIVLTNVAEMCGTTIEECINKSFQVIKNRKGSMQNGTFIKESDS
jgi:NTP pyrophosphatase (non-canonical NTP hydrolase)